MRNVLRQIIQLYPTDTVIVSMESGNNASGRPGALLPAPNTNPNAGLLQLTNNQGVAQEAVSICRIAAIRITSAKYNNDITYLPAPVPAPEGCGADCEAAIRAYLPVGTTGVNVKAGGQTVAQGTVLKNSAFWCLSVPITATPLLYPSAKPKFWTSNRIPDFMTHSLSTFAYSGKGGIELPIRRINMFRNQNIRCQVGMPEDEMERNRNAAAVRSRIFTKILWGRRVRPDFP